MRKEKRKTRPENRRDGVPGAEGGSGENERETAADAGSVAGEKRIGVLPVCKAAGDMMLDKLNKM